MNAVLKPHAAAPHIVADLALAAWGRKEIRIAETEMPGLMAIREEFAKTPAAQGRAHHRLAAHDDPDRRADRDAAGARRRRALGLVQHLLDPGPRRRRASPRTARRCSPIKGESLADYWDYTHRIFEFGAKGAKGEGPNMILDDGGDATLLMHLGKRAEKDLGVIAKPDERGRDAACSRAIKAKLAEDPTWYIAQGRRDHRRDRGDHHRRAPPEGDERQGHAAVPRHQRQRLGHQEQVRQPLRLPRIAGRRHQARHRRDDRRQGRRASPATATSARARRRRCARSRRRSG